MNNSLKALIFTSLCHIYTTGQHNNEEWKLILHYGWDQVHFNWLIYELILTFKKQNKYFPEQNLF